jgi:dienelactone hydrolase
MARLITKRQLCAGSTAMGLFLIAACSGAGTGDGSGSDDTAGNPMTPGVLAPLPPSPPNTNASDPLASGNGVASPPVLGDEQNTPPVSIDPGGPPLNDPDGSGADTPTPAASGDGLIRGDAPTIESATDNGPFDVDTLTTGLRDGPAYGTQTLHVPVGAEPPFASVVIVPGFVSPESSIQAWGPFLASHGIVTLTIGTNSGGDPPEVRASALLDGIETLKAENTRSGSPVEGAMALDRFGVMGWSMGGGGTLIAANENPELRAAVSFAAWSPGVQFSEDQVPTLLLAGSSDILAGGQSQGFFESIPETTPKMLFEVQGGSHSIANDPSSANGEIGRYGLSWLKVFLEGDERYRPFLLETPSQQSDFRDNL